MRPSQQLERAENNIALLPTSGKWSRWARRRGSNVDSQSQQQNQKPARSSATKPRQMAKAQQSELIDYASVVDLNQVVDASGRRAGRKAGAAARKIDGTPRLTDSEAMLQIKQQARRAAQAASSQRPPLSALVPTPALSEETRVAKLWRQYSSPAALVFASAHMLATACAITDIASTPPWMPPTVGAAIGLLFAGLNRYGVVRWWRSPVAPQRVVITGSTKGIGKALAREFLRAGDEVLVTARSPHSVRTTVAELRREMGPEIKVTGTDVDVGSPASVARLANAAPAALGGPVDVWINNAGYSGSFQALVEATPAQVQEVVTTNMLGTLLATRAAILAMEAQPNGGHIFNVDGAGADGSATPNYAAYGATKMGIAHLMGSVSAELEASNSKVAVHTISPGMVLTGLLLSGATAQNKRAFNILCEQPETVAAYLVPRIRTVVARGDRRRYIRYLTPTRVLWFFLMAPLRMRRFFDGDGKQLYAEEWDRMFGPLSKRTRRLAAAAARRTSTLGMVYSLSMAAAYLLIALETASANASPM